MVWRVISAADGHVTAGSFAFRVRNTTGTAGSAQDVGPIAPDAQLAAAADAQIELGDPFRWVIRAITMAGGILLLGGSLFTIGIASPTVADLGEKGRPSPRPARTLRHVRRYRRSDGYIDAVARPCGADYGD